MSGKIELGREAKDVVSGYKGIVTARTEYLNGCVRFHLRPKASKDGKLDEGEWFDEVELERIGDGVRLAFTQGVRAARMNRRQLKGGTQRTEAPGR